MKRAIKYLMSTKIATATYLVLLTLVAFFLCLIIVMSTGLDRAWQLVEQGGNITIEVSSNKHTQKVSNASSKHKQEIRNLVNEYDVDIIYSEGLSISVIDAADIPVTDAMLIGVGSDYSSYGMYNDINLTKPYTQVSDYQVIIPDDLAVEYGVSINDLIDYRVTDSLIKSWQISRLEIVNTYNSSTSENVLYTSIGTVEDIANITGLPIEQQIYIISDDRKSIQKILLSLRDVNENNPMVSFDFWINDPLYDTTIVPMYESLIFGYRGLTISGVFLLLSILILYTRGMKKRQNEIRIYYFLGLRYNDIAKMFALELAIIVIPALLIGQLLGGLYAYYKLTTIGQDISPLNVLENFQTYYDALVAKLDLLMICIFILVIAIALVQFIIYNYFIKKVRLNA